MGISKSPQSSTPLPYLKCDICGSDNIVETLEGYVCRNCGIVLEYQKLQYNEPYNKDILQYSSSIQATQIGTKRERTCSPNSRCLNRLAKQNNMLNNKKMVNSQAKSEISRICKALELPRSFEKYTFEKFSESYKQFRPCTKYRNIEKLIPVVIYFGMKVKHIRRSMRNLLEVSKISKKEFNNFRLQVLAFSPEYQTRDRQELVSQQLLHITEHFELDMAFYHQSRRILYKLWNLINLTTEDAIAGLCASITALCHYKDQVNVNSICRLLGIQMSTIQTQVKSKFFDRFHKEGFVSLVRSSDLLEELMIRLGVIEGEEEVEDVIEVKLGCASRIFNFLRKSYLYHFFIKDYKDNLVWISLKTYRPQYKRRVAKFNGLLEGPLFDLSFRRYFPTKGPPNIKKQF